MGGAPQVAMCVASQIWHIVFASQTLQVFRLALRKKAQYAVACGVVNLKFHEGLKGEMVKRRKKCNEYMIKI